MKIAYKKSNKTENDTCLVINLRKLPTLKEIHYALTEFPGRFA
ncbi:hypothetical protein [Mucilaginibacter phyllosphaerae]|uniref:Uncharacterized protein n=1 Tax=Mucilaginibacter phyllosphaerae TaxID=1812349 RepID=A0ABR6I858_9SPHI|nr:hypothetical protein [Mucilaginibacter phyllosphaerae]MBB3969220.1 hypothetical protein [Mucilaginibacter phyllosphaerae]